MILRARTVITNTGAPIEDGAVAIVGNRIAAVGGFDEIRAAYDGETTDLGEQVLMPGLVNAHCHLDYTMMRRAINPQRTFTEWIIRINALKRSLDNNDYRTAIAKGFSELKQWGTTTVANIESFPELLPDMPPPPIRTWWFFEMIDVRHRLAGEETIAGTLGFFDQRPDWLGGFGLSPHAPYTASGKLYELTADTVEKLGMPVTTHVAESREEWEMFREKRGELHEFMQKLGRWMFDNQEQRTPLAHVAAHARLGPRWLLAHMNELDDSDFTLLATMPQKPSIVHCPGSHRYFRHTRFPLTKLRNIGVNVCLGTDSLASTLTLSMFDEMRILARQEPQLDPSEILKMATLNGAMALGIEAGKIAPGALADLIALPHADNAREVHAAVIENREPVAWMMLDGKILSQ
jgi:cytosine/adenosine deaminase-related metal-dependent hydrolase